MKIRRKKKRKVVVVRDLSFLYDRRHYNWISREWKHFRLKKRLRTAELVVAANERAAADVHKYYRFPVEDTVVMPDDGVAPVTSSEAGTSE